MANKLFIPGPTEVREEVLQELSLPQIGHRTSEFKQLFAGLKQPLKDLFYTKNDVLISTSSGSGLWEASIRSCVNRNVLHAVNGDFSAKWAEVSKQCGKSVQILNYDDGKSVDANDVDKALANGEFEAFCMIHNETSTGVMSDLNSISKVMRKYPNVLWIVDAVSSFAGVKIEVDKLGIDFCLASTQKALALPAGLSVASVSNKCYAKAKEVSGRGYYFDILELKKMYDQDQTPYTPSIPHLYALRKQLQRIMDDGLENRFTRHKEMAAFVRGWAIKNGFLLFPERSDPSIYSDTVSCIVNNKCIDFNEIKKSMAAKGYSIDTGYKKLNEKLQKNGRPTTFRIAHMGDLTLEEIKELTAEMEKYF